MKEYILLCISEGQGNIQCSRSAEDTWWNCWRSLYMCSWVGTGMQPPSCSAVCFLKTGSKKTRTALPSHSAKTVTDTLQQWHVPPKLYVLGSVWLDASLEVVSPPADCSSPVQLARPSAVASASSPSSRFHSFCPSFSLMQPTVGTRTIRFLSSKVVGMKSISFRALEGLPLTKCATQRRSDGLAA